MFKLEKNKELVYSHLLNNKTELFTDFMQEANMNKKYI